MGVMKESRFTLLLCVLSLVACGDDDVAGDAGPTQDSGPGIDAGPGVDVGPGVDGGPRPDVPGVDAGPGEDAGPMSAWAVRTHPCPGINRTDAFHVDADGTLWIGCGSGAEGEGLFASTDEGANWDLVETSPAGIFDNFRVLSIHRGFGDLLYVGGQRPGGTMVVSVDTSSAPFAAEAVLTSGGTVDSQFLASPFVTTASGAAFADSFNGHSALYRPDSSVGDDGGTWTVASEWEDDDSGHQILDMVVDGERFIGCGSTIAEPPFVFLPSLAEGAEPWEMTPVNLAGDGLAAFEGEMWGVDANASRVVVVGVDQDLNVGKIFVSGADRYDGDAYAQIDIDPLLPLGDTDSTWARGVCMDNDHIVVVGEVQPLGVGDNTGFVLESTDGGVTFVDLTPEGSPDTWSKCAIDAAGRVLVAGAGAVGIMN